MKIGIVTQPLTTNYGGILQNYALQTVLKRMGHDVWTIDLITYSWMRWLNMAWRVLAHKLLGHKVSFSKTPTKQKQTETPLRKFVESQISLTSPRIKDFNRAICVEYGFDTIIVGSDQVWRPCYNRTIENMYLQFANQLDVKRIAYAASFGTDEWEYTPMQTQICAGLIKNFDAISVREATGVSLCHDHFQVTAEHVLDPTLLLTKSDYSELCKHIEKQPPFVFAYILDMSEQKVNEIERFASEKGLPYFIKSAGPNVSPDDSVEKWLSYFRDAAFVVTDSFHGTAFSINFGKDFWVYENGHRGNSRFDSLLGLLSLENRMVGGEIKVHSSIEWNTVNAILVRERNRSIEWLASAL